MALEVEDFIEKFHNLKGFSIGEQRRDLFILLKSKPQNIEVLLATLLPINELEKHLKIEMMLHLQAFQQSIEVLKCEQEEFVLKVLKNKRFCQKLAVFLETESHNFVLGVLPRMSFVMRTRLLRKVAKYSTNLDTFFDELDTRYGKSASTYVILACSFKKIKRVLTQKNVRLSVHQLKVLFSKFPSLYKGYLEELQENKIELPQPVVKYIALVDPDTFVTMISKQGFSIKIGKLLTKKVAQGHTETIIIHAPKFMKCLHFKSLYSSLNYNDYKRFYFSACPPKIADYIFDNDLHKITFLTGPKEFDLISEAADVVYGGSIWDYPTLLTNDETIKKLPVETRIKWANIQNDTPELKFFLLKYLDIAECFPIFKARLRKTNSVAGRISLLKLLVSSCEINDDVQSLAELLEYTFAMYPDDDDILAALILMVKDSFRLETLKKRHWKVFNNVMARLKNTATEEWSDDVKRQIHMKHIEFCIAKKEMSNDIFIAIIHSIRFDASWFDETPNQATRKFMIQKAIDVLPKLLKNKSFSNSRSELKIILAILSWNRDNPLDPIPLEDLLLQTLTKSFKVETLSNASLYDLKVIYRSVICCNKDSDFRGEILEEALSHPRYYDSRTFHWLLRRDPGMIEANIEIFLRGTIEHAASAKDLPIFYLVKKYAAIAEQTVQFCVENLELPETPPEQKAKLLLILAIIMPSEDFHKTILGYVPFQDPDAKKGTLVDAARSAKYSKSLQLLPKFLPCGDCISQELAEFLWYLCFHCPEVKLSRLITELRVKGVLLKHVVNLTCRVCSKKDIMRLLTVLAEGQRMFRLDRCLFNSVVPFFFGNPTENLWKLVKVFAGNVNRYDAKFMTRLVHVGGIPGKYQAQYVRFAWDLLKKYDASEWRMKLLGEITENAYRTLSADFLHYILKNNLFLSLLCKYKEMNAFVAYILAYVSSPEIHAKIIDTIFENLDQFLKQRFATVAAESKARISIEFFIMTLVQTLSTGKVKHKRALHAFSLRWHCHFSSIDHLEEHLALYLSLLLMDYEHNLKEFIVQIKEYAKDLERKLGHTVMDFFAGVLRFLLPHFTDNCQSRYLAFCDDLLNVKTMQMNVLALRLMPAEEDIRNCNYKQYDLLINRIKGISNDRLKVILNLYLKRSYI